MRIQKSGHGWQSKSGAENGAQRRPQARSAAQRRLDLLEVDPAIQMYEQHHLYDFGI